MIPVIFWIVTGIENAPAEIHKDEDQHGKGFCVFLHVLLPIAGLALLWGQRGFFSKLLLQLDRSCVSVYCPSFSKREKLLKWASDRLPTTWSSQARTLSSGIPELWKDGSLLCTIINSVVPGACPNPHRHWRKSPLHAQALAYKYLGLIPIFTEEDFSNGFTINQERKFIQYLHKFQEAINKWPTNLTLNHKLSSQYVARGMGLYTGEQYRKTIFYIYSNATGRKRSNVIMYIRGPYGTKGSATISPFHNLQKIPIVNVLQNQLEATKTLPFKNEEQKSFLKTISLDFTSLISDIDDKKEKNDIPIQIDMEIDRAKVTYIPNDNGIYEINLICDGEVLRGSPYSVQVNNNTSGKIDSFDSNYENVEEKMVFTKRKIISKIIDCIDEKIYIDNTSVSKMNKDSPESSTENESDEVTITAITKKKDEILKTEISCTLEDIIEEINLNENKIEENDEIKKIREHLKAMPDVIANTDETDGLHLQVGTKHKIVKDCDKVQTEIVNLLQRDEVDKVNYNVEKDLQVLDKPDVSKLDIGHIKDIVTNPVGKEPEEPPQVDEDENNNSKNTPIKRIKSKITLEITPKLSKTRSASTNLTSPICPSHIVSEVENNSVNQFTLEQKRKAFCRQNSFNIPDSEVTFSSENDDSSKPSNFGQLSVLNVLNSLKQSRKKSLSEASEHSLTSTISLPNISSPDSQYETFEGTFRARKEYWERMSSRSSSSVSLVNSDYSENKRNTAHDNKKNETIVNYLNKCEKTNRRKISNSSADSKTSQQDKSDNSLEDCSLIPLEERKKNLLKRMYESGTYPPQKNAKGKKTLRAPEKIQSFNKNSQEKNLEHLPLKEAKNSIKSQFKNAISFFKRLEGVPKQKNDKKSLTRRYSLDFQKKAHRNVRSGSLTLPYISDRFQVTNLYKDVFGNRRGSFKGTPNTPEVVNSLASFSHVVAAVDQSQNEDDICYDLFVNKGKTKKRKGIKSFFNINY